MRHDDTPRHRLPLRRGALLGCAAACAAAPALAAAATGPIAFDALGTGIEAVSAAGGPAVAVVANGGEPAWSPDGRHLAYTGGSAGVPANEVWVSAADGSGARLLVRETDSGVVQSLRPDGSVAQSVANVQAVPTDFDGGLAGPSWSRDGRAVRLAVVGLGSTARFIRVDVATGAVRRLATVRYPRNAAWSPREVAWSPAGRLVAFTVDIEPPPGVRCGSEPSRVYVYRLGARDARRVAPRRALCQGRGVRFSAPAFSPDGTRLVLTRGPASNSFGFLTDLVTVRIGRGGGPLTEPRPTSPGLRYARSAAYSPDGARIAYALTPRNSGLPGGIGVMNADGTGRTTILSRPDLFADSLDWSPGPG